MTVQIYSPDCDASAISGFTVVVDVLRAFSVSYFINANKPAKYLITDSIERAFELKSIIPNAVLIGERQGIKIPGFDFGNSPTELVNQSLSGKTVIHTTTAGTKGLVAQNNENEVVVGSFVNARALLEYITHQGISVVNIYCTARKDAVNGQEDYFFADYLRSSLMDAPFDFEAAVEIMKQGTGKGFGETGFAPYTDFAYCMERDRFASVLRVKKESAYAGTLELEEIRGVLYGNKS